MKITFHGAAGCVTGSSTLVEHDGFTLLVDIGMAQGNDERRIGNDLAFKAGSVDAVILTHSHIDHSGRLPLLVKEGFKGTVYSTEATEKLCSIMLADSANIQESEAEWNNRKRRRSGEKPVSPLYTSKDARDAMRLFNHVQYNERVYLQPGLSFELYDAGHLLGSASVRIFYMEEGKEKSIVFSGDIGNTAQPMIKDPVPIGDADYVVMESTYGDRNHKDGVIDERSSIMMKAEKLASIIDRTFRRGGNVVVPSFAVGRTQEILYLLRIIIDRKMLGYDVPVFLDSPLSEKATRVFSECLRKDYFDKEAMEMIKRGENPVSFPSLVAIEDAEGSKALNYRKESAVIISSSGMCEAGRIRHHLKHNLWRRESTVLFVGYQAEGTLGRLLVDGADHVTLFGEQIEVHAEIEILEGVSGHADQAGLIRWIEGFAHKPVHVFVNHGEKSVARYFAYKLHELGYSANAPDILSSYDLGKDALPEAESIRLEERTEHDLSAGLSFLENKKNSLENLIALLEKAAEEESDSRKKRKLADDIARLGSDLEFLAMKWRRK